MMRAAPVLLLLVTALAGCSDAPEPDPGAHDVPESLAQDGYDPAAAPVEAPEWKVGDYWSFKDSLGQEYSLVVAQDAGGDWEVLTNDKTIARFDALFDISFVGKMRKSDLAGQQGDERIQFFDFPLEHGKTWMTVWDGEVRHVVAHGLPDGKFHVIAHVAGNEVGDAHANYVYDSKTGHFDSITFFDANGTVGYAAQRTGAGHDFSGTLYRFGAAESLANMTVGAYAMQRLDVADATGELTFSVTIDCGAAGTPLYAVQEPQEDGSSAAAPPTPVVDTVEPVMGNDAACPEAAGTDALVVEDPRPGAWRFDGSTTGDATIHFTAKWRPREDIPL